MFQDVSLYISILPLYYLRSNYFPQHIYCLCLHMLLYAFDTYQQPTISFVLVKKFSIFISILEQGQYI
jgi:hypothetical protein